MGIPGNVSNPGISPAALSWAQAVLGPTAGGELVQAAIVSGAQTFNGHLDPAVYYGININIAGQPIVAGVPGMAWGLETNYDDASGHIKSEAYLQWNDGTVSIRPFFTQIDTVTEAVTAIRLQSSAGVNITLDNGTAPWILFTPNLVTINPQNQATNQLVMAGDGAGGHGCTIQLGFGATANAGQVHTSGVANLQLIPGGVANVVTVQAVSTGSVISVNTGSNQAAGIFVSPATGTKSLVARPIAAQTVNIFESQDSGGTAHIFINPNQSLVVGNAALATTATDGFLYLPTCAGAPTGVPTAETGTAACVYDTTDNKLWVYNGAWKGVVLS